MELYFGKKLLQASSKAIKDTDINMNKHNSINYVEFPAKDLASTKTFFNKIFADVFCDRYPRPPHPDPRLRLPVHAASSTIGKPFVSS